MTDASKKACMAKENPIDWEKYLSSEQYAELFDNEHFDSPIYLYGLSGSVGFDDFAVKNFMDFESETVDRTPFGASAFFGVSPNSSALYLGAGVQYRVQYKSADSRTICPDEVADEMLPDNLTECFSGAFANPNKDKDATIFGVARRQVDLPLGAGAALPIGVELKVAYDAEDKVFGVSAPLYLLSNADGALRGGVRVDWQEDKDVKLGVFVSSAFSIFD